MAVRITRQPNKLALIGAPTSAAAHQPGLERAPEALRAAGLVEKLTALGFEVTDLGDCPVKTFQQDDEHPRARNAAAVVAMIDALKPKVEQATKSGTLPVILGGDCAIALGTIAGVRRYFRNVSLVWTDSDADLNVPATTPSGRLDGMVVAHIIGRGAPEVVRFWGEPPLVRPTEIQLFGYARLDPPEEELLNQLPIRRHPADHVLRKGAAVAAQAAMEHIRTGQPFVLHFDVDALAQEDFSACNFPGTGGLRVADIRAALEVFVGHPECGAFEISEYNPEKDADGSGARLLVDLIAAALAARFHALVTAPAEAAARAAAEKEAEAPTAEAPAAEARAPESESSDSAVVAESTQESAEPAAPPVAEAVAASDEPTEETAVAPLEEQPDSGQEPSAPVDTELQAEEPSAEESPAEEPPAEEPKPSPES